MDNALLARSFEHTTRYLTKLIRRTPMSFDPDRPYNDLPLLDFRPIQGRRKVDYFAAVRAGLDRNYKPMEEIFELLLNRTSSGT